MLYFDEQVTHRLADAILADGIDDTTVNLLGHKGQSDAVQLLRAAELGRVVVTHNVRDFILLHDAWLAWSEAWQARRQSKHAGILVIHPVNSPSIEGWAREIISLLRAVDSLSNRLFSWDRRNGWQEYRDRRLFPFHLSIDLGDDGA